MKPVIKKVMTKVQTMLGKTPYKPNLSEVRTNVYREKRGLPPVRDANGKVKKAK